MLAAISNCSGGTNTLGLIIVMVDVCRDHWQAGMAVSVPAPRGSRTAKVMRAMMPPGSPVAAAMMSAVLPPVMPRAGMRFAPVPAAVVVFTDMMTVLRLPVAARIPVVLAPMPFPAAIRFNGSVGPAVAAVVILPVFPAPPPTVRLGPGIAGQQKDEACQHGAGDYDLLFHFSPPLQNVRETANMPLGWLDGSTRFGGYDASGFEMVYNGEAEFPACPSLESRIDAGWADP